MKILLSDVLFSQ